MGIVPSGQTQQRTPLQDKHPVRRTALLRFSPRHLSKRDIEGWQKSSFTGSFNIKEVALGQERFRRNRQNLPIVARV